MDWLLIEEDILYKEEVTYSDSYVLRGVFYEAKESVTYKPFFCTDEPYRQGEESMMLPAGSSAEDARVIYTKESLMTYDDVNDITIADKVYLSNPEYGKNKPQRYIVMNKEDWAVNSGFKLIKTDTADCYLIMKEEKVVDNGT